MLCQDSRVVCRDGVICKEQATTSSLRWLFSTFVSSQFLLVQLLWFSNHHLLLLRRNGTEFQFPFGYSLFQFLARSRKGPATLVVILTESLHGFLQRWSLVIVIYRHLFHLHCSCILPIFIPFSNSNFDNAKQMPMYATRNLHYRHHRHRRHRSHQQGTEYHLTIAPLEAFSTLTTNCPFLTIVSNLSAALSVPPARVNAATLFATFRTVICPP